jgi:hypothetical protein
VCEDLEMLLRLHEEGRHGKYIAYPGHDFGEAVTRVSPRSSRSSGATRSARPRHPESHLGVGDRAASSRSRGSAFAALSTCAGIRSWISCQFFSLARQPRELVPLAVMTGSVRPSLPRPQHDDHDAIIFGSFRCRPSTCCAGKAGSPPCRTAECGRRGSEPLKAVAAQFALSYTLLGILASRSAAARSRTCSAVRWCSTRRSPTTSASCRADLIFRRSRMRQGRS